MEFKVENGGWNRQLEGGHADIQRRTASDGDKDADSERRVSACTPVQPHRTHQGTDQDPGKHCEKSSNATGRNPP